MSNLDCKVEVFSKQETPQEFTVGDIFLIRCLGDVSPLKGTKLAYVLAPEDKYKLILLESQHTDKELTLQSTSYFVGQHEFKDLKVSDGQNEVLLSPLKVNVKSVLEAQVQQEPYGPIGPIDLRFPMWVYLIAFSILLFLIIMLGFKFWRVWQRRKMIADLKAHDSPLTPIQQFSREIRRIERQYNPFYGKEPQVGESEKFIKDVNEKFRLYLTRRFQVPALIWSDKLIFKDIKRNHKELYKKLGKNIEDVLKEISKAGQGDLSSRDFLQMTEMLKRVVDNIYQFKGEK